MLHSGVLTSIPPHFIIVHVGSNLIIFRWIDYDLLFIMLKYAVLHYVIILQ
jgi:hypothetical protein